MARVFLLNPPSPEPVRSPLLSFAYLAAALRRANHDVALLDSSAPFGPADPAAIASIVERFRPDLIGIHIKTLHAQPAYDIAKTLIGAVPMIAGGPHPTVVPGEALTQGFTFEAHGEGEEILVELASALDGKGRRKAIAGLWGIENGQIWRGPPRPFITDLDRLASPIEALDLFDPAWYGQTKAVPPSGLLSSRGCPAACTFCSNNVTGRRFRYHAPSRIVSEVRSMRTRFGATAFTFLDDSFAVGQRRMVELCEALSHEPVSWTCTAHPAHLQRATLEQMKRAGCGGVDIGMESADPAMLLEIGKGTQVERVLQVLADCKDLGIHTVVNLMFGWPGETEAQLGETMRFMEKAAPIVGGFNARGVLVPYPGTEIYERHADRSGFRRWWIDEPPIDYETFPTSWDRDEIQRVYGSDAALARNFFRHPPSRIASIDAALKLKASLTMQVIERGMKASHAVPAAGAR